MLQKMISFYQETMKFISDSLTTDSKATLAIAFTFGYLVDTILRNTVLRRRRVKSSKYDDLDRDSLDEEEDDEDEDDNDDDYDDDDNDEYQHYDSKKHIFTHEDYKMVLVINSELKMGKGKVAAQCAHAAIAAFKIALRKNPLMLKCWSKSGQTKITVKANDEDELMYITQKAKEANLITEIIQDAGRTQILAGSKTVCVIGPGPSVLIDKITGTLKLY